VLSTETTADNDDVRKYNVGMQSCVDFLLLSRIMMISLEVVSLVNELRLN
jgi:hypothetical protein